MMLVHRPSQQYLQVHNSSGGHIYVQTSCVFNEIWSTVIP